MQLNIHRLVRKCVLIFKNKVTDIITVKVTMNDTKSVLLNVTLFVVYIKQLS